METRKEKAIRLFKSGYNCSQSVFAAYADKYGIDEETAFRLSASFGGGMGRMREVCGAVSGMFMVAGLETGATEGKDAEGKKANYDMVQKMAEAYRKENGSIICKELLGLVPMPESKTREAESTVTAAAFTDTRPEARTEEYYQKRPCVELVGQACDIIENVLYAAEK
ncbi:MAG: C-GCAxxG-C-C family protein [Butyribacter sp.]|nr:C-GCAxxG-C-C family protein [bacterium]MDY3855127.1 C-GCAxxG-C-C family protein [Butyribacter sp.]